MGCRERYEGREGRPGSAVCDAPWIGCSGSGTLQITLWCAPAALLDASLLGRDGAPSYKTVDAIMVKIAKGTARRRSRHVRSRGLQRASKVFLGAVLWTVPALPSPDHAALPASVVESIVALVTEYRTAHRVPALAMAIVKDGELAWSQGFGEANIEIGAPASASTVFRTGSIGKTMTATAAMQLVEQHKLDLDADVRKYCPSFPERLGRSLRATSSRTRAASDTTVGLVTKRSSPAPHTTRMSSLLSARSRMTHYYLSQGQSSLTVPTGT